MKELIKLAKEKGFESKLRISFNSSFTAKEHINNAYYFWMCELQKWLRGTHNIDVETYLISSFKNDIEQSQEREEKSYTFQIFLEGLKQPYSPHNIYFSYEKALEKGLFETLKLL